MSVDGRWDALRSDLLKLRRPLTAIGLLGVIMATVSLVWKAQAETATAFHAATGVGNTCVGACLDAIWSTNALAAVQQDPVGIGGVAAGFAASLPGAIAVFAIAAAHVAGERSGRTMAALAAREPRVLRLLLLKFVSVLLFAYAMLLAVWTASVPMAMVFRRAFPIPPAPSPMSPGAFAAGQVVRAALVLAALAAIGTIAGSLARTPLGAFGMSAGLLVAGFPLAVPAWLLSPSYWIAHVMRFDHEQLWQGHVWFVQRSVVGGDATVVGMLLVTALAPIPFAWWRRRKDVTSAP